MANRDENFTAPPSGAADKWLATAKRMAERYKETGKFTSDAVDNEAFDNMQRSTDRAPDRLFKEGRMFTESEYIPGQLGQKDKHTIKGLTIS